ncbi:MAG: VanZ family protein [Pseudodesulfovibrio sp.]
MQTESKSIQPKKISILALWGGSILAIIYLSLQPGADVPTPFIHSDKVGHFIAYGWLGFLPAVAFSSRQSIWVSAAAMILLGVVLEFCQSYVPQRMASPGDMVANTLGVFIGIYLAGVVLKSTNHQSD